jgi:CBS domain-containing protein
MTPASSRKQNAASDAAARPDLRDLLVSEVMGHPAVTIESHADLNSALRLFAAFGVRHLIVVDVRGRCAGVLTDRAVAGQWAAHPSGLDRISVGDACVPEAPRVRQRSTLTGAAQAMREVGIDAAVVVDDDDAPIGVVTATDLIAALAKPAR